MKILGWIIIISCTVLGVNYIIEYSNKDYSFDGSWGIAKDKPLR